MREKENIEVAAAIIEKDKKVLITKRKKKTHLPNYWEFPGGKRRKGEDLKSCLIREIREELQIEIYIKEEILSTTHNYPDRKIAIHFFTCDWKGGEPVPVGCEEFKWVDQSTLDHYEFPPANSRIIDMLRRQA